MRIPLALAALLLCASAAVALAATPATQSPTRALPSGNLTPTGALLYDPTRGEVFCRIATGKASGVQQAGFVACYDQAGMQSNTAYLTARIDYPQSTRGVLAAIPLADGHLGAYVVTTDASGDVNRKIELFVSFPDVPMFPRRPAQATLPLVLR